MLCAWRQHTELYCCVAWVLFSHSLGLFVLICGMGVILAMSQMQEGKSRKRVNIRQGTAWVIGLQNPPLPCAPPSHACPHQII